MLGGERHGEWVRGQGELDVAMDAQAALAESGVSLPLVPTRSAASACVATTNPH